MTEGGKQILNLRELREASGIPLGVDDFITKLGPYENPRLFIPIPIVPAQLMDYNKASEAQSLLSKCIRVVGPWGDRESQKESSDFKRVAEQFKKITGVDAWEIISEARSRRDALLEID